VSEFSKYPPDHGERDTVPGRDGFVPQMFVFYAHDRAMKNWIHDERVYYPNSEIMNPCITLQDGLIAPCPTRLGQWERQPIALQVSDAYEKFIMDFQNYFEEEASAIGDPTLEQEVKLMEKLIAY